MKIKLQANELKSILRTLQLADKTSTVLFDTDAGLVSVVGPKLSIAVKHPAIGQSEGEVRKFAVNLQKLAEVVSGLSGEIEFIEKDGLTVHSGRSRFKLALVATSLNPPEMPEEKGYVLPLVDLKSMLAFSHIATGLTDVPFFACYMVQLMNAGRYLRTAGTDGQRLMLAESTLPDSYGNILIQAQAVRALMELPDKTVRFLDTETALFFQGATATIVASKRIKDFPDVEKIYPKKFALEFSVHANDVLAGLKQVAPMAGGKVQISYDGYSLGLFADSEGEAETEIEAKAVYPEPLFEEISPLAIRFNHKHLTDFFNAVSGEVYISLNDSTTPALFTGYVGENARKMLVVPLV
jgi:DNA polymerase III sliding clamp (beta) subunit (PCNA family)